MSTPETDAYFDHDADIGIIGHGDTLEQAFVSAAQAMFGIIGDTSSLQPDVAVQFQFEEDDNELALVTWLNLLLAHSREQGALFGYFEVRHQGALWYGEAHGQKWNTRMERGVEVKGATLTMLSVKRSGNKWEARCVVDV